MLSIRAVALVAAVAFLAMSAQAAECNTKANITYPPNLIPIDTSSPKFVAKVPNGELYTVGTPNNNEISVVHLYGNNGYDFGYAAGQLIGWKMNRTLSTMWAYFKEQVEQSSIAKGIVKKYKIPKWLEDMIIQDGLEAALDLLNDLTSPYVNEEIYAEMRGMADATGIDYKLIRRIHLIGELTKGSCSLYGTWGDATLDGKTLQLRALDWDTGAGLQNFPSVTIYHPLNEKMGVAFANVGWCGWIGTLTGMNSKHIGISEIGVSDPNFPPYFGDESYQGIPFVFLERQIIQYTTSYTAAMDMIKNATRTCDLILGVGDGNAKTARMVQYSHSIVRFFDDTNLEPSAWWHPRINQTVYNGMDWFCPFYQHSLYRQLTYAHGKLTPELSIRNVTSVVGTGDLHAAVYDLTDLQLYVANARPENTTAGAFEAYGRGFIKLDLATAFQKQFGK